MPCLQLAPGTLTIASSLLAKVRRATSGRGEPEHDRCRICTTTVVVRVRPPGAGALGTPSTGRREGALSVGSARVCVVDELVERVDGQDRVLGGSAVGRPAGRVGCIG